MTTLVCAQPTWLPAPSGVAPGVAVARRDDVWLRDLHDSHWASMVRLATLLLGSTDQAEEIVQEALLAVFQRRNQFSTLDHAGAYLRAAVVNRTRSAHRHRGAVERFRPDPRPSPSTPEEEILSAERAEQMFNLVHELPRRQREVLVLRYYSGASEAEIADALGISRGAVKSHAHRGIEALRAKMEGSRHG